MKIKVTKTGITDHNAIVAVDEVVDYDDANAKRLIATGYAVAVEEQPGQEDTEAAVKKAIDAKYKADELKAKATEVGVEFEKDIKKSDLISLIVTTGKSGLFLE